jgi:hypothetical protein
MLELKSKEQLNSIIINENGKPYKTAIEIYWYLRSWYSPIKAEKANGKSITLDKLHTDGIHILKDKLAKEFNCGSEAIRRAIVFLDKLGLIGRGFESKGKSVNHLVLYIWKNTPHFYNKFGVTKEQVGELKTHTSHEYITKKVDTPPCVQNKHTPLLVKVETPILTINTAQEGILKHTEEQLITGVEGDRWCTRGVETPLLVKVETYNLGKKKEEDISLRDNISSSNSSSPCGERGKRKNKTNFEIEKNVSAEKIAYAEMSVKTSFAFGSEEVLPPTTKTSFDVVDGNLALAVVPKSEVVSEASNTLSNANFDDLKWQDIHQLILKNFREEMAWGIIHNLSITPIKPNRIQLKFVKDLGFTEDQKETLRQCLRTVYGPHIEMILSQPEAKVSKESLNVKVHIFAKDDKRLPEGLKAQFTAMEEEKTADVIVQEEAAIDAQKRAYKQPKPVSKAGSTIASVEYGRSYAENKWAQVRVAVENSVYPSSLERLKHYLSQVEVIGMTDRLLKLEAPWFPYEKIQDHQTLIERIAAKYDVDLEIKNKDDGSKLYMPWTYPSHELPPLELDNILKKCQ